MDAADKGEKMKTRIYAIEDDQSVIGFLKHTLELKPEWELAGHSPTYADALSYAALHRADVYLIDLGLPDGRGEDLIKVLRRSNPQAELLVFTVFGEESRLVEALEFGATGYVLKGCSSEELIAAVEQILAGGAPISALLARLLLKRFQVGGPSTSHMEGAAEDLSSKENKGNLSDREMEVLRLVAQGYLNKEIAYKLGISMHTVGSHIKNLYLKLSVHTKVQVVRAAQERGLV
jgi:DNA-binding NarL/FixJ family response regulator